MSGIFYYLTLIGLKKSWLNYVYSFLSFINWVSSIHVRKSLKTNELNSNKHSSFCSRFSGRLFPPNISGYYMKDFVNYLHRSNCRWSTNHIWRHLGENMFSIYQYNCLLGPFRGIWWQLWRWHETGYWIQWKYS